MDDYRQFSHFHHFIGKNNMIDIDTATREELADALADLVEMVSAYEPEMWADEDQAVYNAAVSALERIK